MPDPREFLASLERKHRAQDDNSAKGRAIRSYREHYKLGRLTRARPDNPPGRSGNAAIWESADLMHRRVRAAYDNNPIFRRCTHVLRDLIVGSGIQAFSDPIDYSFGWKLDKRPENVLIRSLDYALETDESFDLWACDKNQVDIGGRWDWFWMQRMVIQELILVGSVIVKKCARRDQDIPFCLQLIEREQINYQYDRPRAGDQNAIINGIEVDRDGREVAVHLWREHPHDGFAAFSQAGFESFRLPKSQYEHIFMGVRPTQTIGATWLNTIGTPTQDRDSFTEAELRAAIKAARLLLVAHIDNPGAGALGFEDFGGDGDPLGRPELALGNDIVAAEVGKDEKVELIESQRPTDKANNFFDILDHDIAAGTDASYYSVTGRFEKTNQSGFRGAMNFESAQMRPIQEWFGRSFVLPVRRRWNELAVGLGRLRNVTASQFNRERNRYQRFEVYGPGRSVLDPDKETEGSLTELRGGLSTLKRECARRQLHWIKVLRQVALENRIADVLGVALDHSKGQGGQRDKNTRTSEREERENANE